MSKNTNSKKEQFTQPEKNKIPVIIGYISVALVAILVLIFLLSSGESNENSINYFGDPVAEARSYMGKVISKTEITPDVIGGEIRIPLELVDRHNIVSFKLPNNEGVLVPLMAYITPSGRLFVGSSMCEPCGGRTFSLAGETLLCDACRTTYTIEDHVFISGSRACGQFPPVYLNPRVVDGIIIIDLQSVLTWRRRA